MDSEEILQHLTISGIPVVKLRKGIQIVYKLGNNLSSSSLTPSQRAIVTNEIVKLHKQDSLDRLHNPNTASFLKSDLTSTNANAVSNYPNTPQSLSSRTSYPTFNHQKQHINPFPFNRNDLNVSKTLQQHPSNSYQYHAPHIYANGQATRHLLRAYHQELPHQVETKRRLFP